jgi:hypothetical protein
LNNDLDTIDAIFSASGTSVALNIDGANIDSSPVGATTPSTGAFSTLSASGALDLNGAVQLDATLTVGVNDTGYDVKFFGATSGQYLLWDESADDLIFTDNTKAVFGTGSDLQIYHDGSNSYIKDVGTGSLVIASGGMFLQNAAADENMIRALESGAVTLYYANAAKLATVTGGVDVTGTLTASGGITSTAAANSLGATSFNEGDLTNIGTIYADQYLGDADANSGIVLPGSDVMTLHTAGSERMRIDSSGKVGIGVASPFAPLQINQNVGGTTLGKESTILMLRGANNNNTYSQIGFQWTHTNELHPACTIGWQMTSFSGNTKGDLIFGTRSVTTDTAPTERMRITSSGRVFIGDSTFGGTSAIFAAEVPASGAGCLIRVDSAADAAETMLQFQDAASQGLGSITSNPSANTTAYNTSSDGRLKDITGEAKGLEIINALNPVAFTWKSSGVKAEGLIAQEVEKLVDHAVSKTKESEYLQMDYSKLVTPLIKAVQELSAEVEQLKQQAHEKCEN